jgi:ssDNA-binding Zn-finger/Zn-ribbon topoisomerase 1
MVEVRLQREYDSRGILESMTTKIQFMEWSKCPKCGHANIKAIGPPGFLGFDHADVCEYLTFRDVTAPKIGWALIKGVESCYSVVAFNTCGIEHRVFKVSGVGGRCVEVYAPEHIAAMIKVYYSDKSPYGGMGLSEYLNAVIGVTSITGAT